MGVAGSYLLRRLSLEHDVVGFENQRRESFKYNRRKKGGSHEYGRLYNDHGHAHGGVR